MLRKIFYFAIIDTRKFDADQIVESGFMLTPLNLILFFVIFLLGKILLRYLRRYFKALELTKKSIKIEGREFALWKLIRQFIYLIIFYACFQSLKVTNSNIDFSNILKHEFTRVGDFHIAVYHLFVVVITIFISRILVNFLKLFINKNVNKKSTIDQGTEFVIIQLAKYIIYTIAIIVVIRSFGIGMDLLLGGLAAFVVALSLGLQDIFKDFFSGLLLLFEGTLKVGDIIEIPNYNNEDQFVARIQEINLRTSKVMTRNDSVLIVPNSKLTHEGINNWSYGSKLTRFQIPITVHYGVDLDLVKQLLIESAQKHPKVKKTKPVFVRLIDFGNHGLELDLVFWAEQNFYIEIHKSEIRFIIDKAFREAGIKIPYPQNDIHIKNN